MLKPTNLLKTTLILLTISLQLKGQNDKGTIGILGEIALTQSKIHIKDASNLESKLTENKYIFQPTFQYRLAKRWLLNGSFGLVLAPNYISSVLGDAKSVAIYGGARYYFNPDASWKIYGQIRGGVINGNYEPYYDNFYLDIAVGANHFINPNIALNLKAGLGYDDLTTEGGFYLKCDLENATLFRKKEEDKIPFKMPKFSLGGQFRLDYYPGNYNSEWLLNFSPEIAYFVGNRTLIGLKHDLRLNHTTGTVRYNLEYATFGLYGRYYIPLINRFYVYPQIEVKYISNINSKYFVFQGGMGLSYFISPYMAIESSLYEFSTFKREQNFFNDNKSTYNINNYGLTMKLRYFLN
jgi:hypothetical protein